MTTADNRLAKNLLRIEGLERLLKTLWGRTDVVLRDATVELQVNLEIFAAECDRGGSPPHSRLQCLRRFLQEVNFPDWEDVYDSVLQYMSESELLLVFTAKELQAAKDFVSSHSLIQECTVEDRAHIVEKCVLQAADALAAAMHARGSIH
jgi:hypothetical protein